MDGKKESKAEQQPVLALYNAIAYYVERQHLVVQCMLDMGLDLEEIGKWGPLAWSQQNWVVESSCPLLDESSQSDELLKIANRASQRGVKQKGRWGTSDEWEYYLHGTGCKLLNHHTGEPIDWSCPNPEAFDPYSFIEHLCWRLKSARNDELSSIRSWVLASGGDFESVRELVFCMKERGIIKSDWTLSPREDLASL